MSYTHHVILWCMMLACCSSFVVMPVHAFTANSLDITIDKNGDAIATFRFTLEGIIENSIPQSVLEEELKKGLTTSNEPPELISMNRSSAVLLMKKFADTSDQPTGTGYLTATMDFKKAEVALQNSALSGVVSADFSPEKIVLTFPDSYQREYTNVDVLPAVAHTVIDPSKTPQATTSPAGTGAATGAPAETGRMNITSSPLNVKVYLDSSYIGEAPGDFPDITTGTHLVEFRKDSYESVSKNVTIITGKTTNVMVVLPFILPATTEGASSFPGIEWLLLIIGIIILAAGGYLSWSEKQNIRKSEKTKEKSKDEALKEKSKNEILKAESRDKVLKEKIKDDTLNEKSKDKARKYRSKEKVPKVKGKDKASKDKRKDETLKNKSE